MRELRALAQRVWALTAADDKVQALNDALSQAHRALNGADSIDLTCGVVCLREPQWAQFLEKAFALDPQVVFPDHETPGRPETPVLLPPQKVSQRGLGTEEGRCAMLHALAHIEFNAINLALDAVWRFPGMPPAYYRDWFLIAIEEAYHFSLIRQRLREAGRDYGDFPAHDGLWEAAHRTRHDLMARLAVVPRTFEAKGLDACPLVKKRFSDIRDHASAALIDIILRDEVGHVAAGNRWFQSLCEQQGLAPGVTARTLCERYRAPVLKPPFNLEARRRAGFPEDDLTLWGG